MAGDQSGTDEIFMAAQEAVGAATGQQQQRDSQGGPSECCVQIYSVTSLKNQEVFPTNLVETQFSNKGVPNSPSKQENEGNVIGQSSNQTPGAEINNFERIYVDSPLSQFENEGSKEKSVCEEENINEPVSNKGRRRNRKTSKNCSPVKLVNIEEIIQGRKRVGRRTIFKPRDFCCEPNSICSANRNNEIEVGKKNITHKRRFKKGGHGREIQKAETRIGQKHKQLREMMVQQIPEIQTPLQNKVNAVKRRKSSKFNDLKSPLMQVKSEQDATPTLLDVEDSQSVESNDISNHEFKTDSDTKNKLARDLFKYYSLPQEIHKKGSYECNQCGRKYCYLRGLRQHQRLECNVPPQFPCPFCSVKCRYRHVIRDHVKYNHALVFKMWYKHFYLPTQYPPRKPRVQTNININEIPAFKTETSS